MIIAGVLFWAAAQAVAAGSGAVQVRISGVEGELRGNVEAALAVPEGMVKDGEMNRLWLRRFIDQAPRNVRKALEPFGHYHADVTVTPLRQDEGGATIEVDIVPGPAVTIAGVSIELHGDGRGEPPLLRQVKEFPLKTGDVLRHDLYEQGKAEIEAAAVDLGYIKGSFSRSRIEVVLYEHRADILLTFDTGPQYRFGAITFQPETDYPERFLRRYLTITPGQVFSYAALGQTQAQFLDSDRFRQVLIVPGDEDAVRHEIPVSIVLETRPRRSLRPGVGYGTDTGGRFSLLYRDLNIWEMGHQLDMDMVIAEIRQSVNAVYILPNYRNVSSLTAFRGGLEREDTETYLSRKIYAEAEVIYSHSRTSVFSVYARLQREDYEVGDTDETTESLMPGIRWRHRTYTSPTRPVKGYHLGLEMRGTREGVISDFNLVQLIGEANTLIPLPGRFSLFLRGSGAMTIQDDELADIPVSLRFFAGGDQSVRGYGYQTLGPVDAAGAVVGGKHLLVGSVELERAIGSSWGIAAFYDTGNAFNNLSDYELARAVGAGLRWYTIVGPLKIDVARQLGVDDPEYRFHASIGFAW